VTRSGRSEPLALAQQFGDAVQRDLGGEARGGGEVGEHGVVGGRGQGGRSILVQNRALVVAGAQTEEGMGRLIGISTAALLFALGLLHVYWAAGGKWGTDVTIPKQDGTPLFQPPPAGTLLVAIPVGHVPAAALQLEARARDQPDPALAPGTAREWGIGDALHLLEVPAVLAAVLVSRHPGPSNLRQRG
jgi:hypothetical protein